MRVLIACEYSGRVRDAFIAKGHDARSCDLLSSDAWGPHYQDDVANLLIYGWDMIIAFPPCTHLASSGARWFKEKIADGRQQEGINFFMQFTNHPCPRICIENPIGIMSTKWRKPDQIIHPWMFGQPFQKSTCLWLKGLPPLVPTDVVGKGEFVIHGGKKMPKWYSNRSRSRDKTFKGIAEAMAQQWGLL